MGNQDSIPTMKTALIAGSTGLVGSELLQLLVDNPAYKQVHILVRKEVALNSSKIRTHIINFENLSTFDPGEKIDHVFCTLGTTIKKAKTKENFRKVDYDYVLALGEQSLSWKAEKFLMVSSLGASSRSGIFYNRVKGEIEKALEALPLAHLFIFRPSLLMGNRKEFRAAEKSAMNIYKVLNPLFIGKLKKYRGIQAEKVARAMMVTALENNEKYKIFESDEIQKF